MWPFKKQTAAPETDNDTSDVLRCDPQARANLLAEIERQKSDSSQPPVVPMDLFFEGNESLTSIGRNLDPPPGPRHFLNVLTGVHLRAEIVDILVEIADANVDLHDPLGWPTSNRIYFVARAPLEQVGKWLVALEPSHLTPEVDNTRLSGLKSRPGTFIYAAYWG